MSVDGREVIGCVSCELEGIKKFVDKEVEWICWLFVLS